MANKLQQGGDPANNSKQIQESENAKLEETQNEGDQPQSDAENAEIAENA